MSTTSAQHYAVTEQCSQVFQLFRGADLLLECDRVVRLNEVNRERRYPEVIYFPPQAVASLKLVKTARHSFCPIKGTASYWSFGSLENCAWSYLEPVPDMVLISNHFAFDAGQGFHVIAKT